MNSAGTKSDHLFDGRFNNRIAVVSGGGKGIGRAIAERLAREGATVVVLDKNGESAARAVKEIGRESGGEAAAFTCDVSHETDVKALFEAVDNRFGRLDILVNNAGISIRIDGEKTPVETTPLDVWQRTLNVNLTGVFLMCRAAIPLLKRSQHGRIINIGSMAARTRTQFTANYYAASKAGLLGFSRVLAGELAPAGITVNYVAPTRIDTDLAKTHADVASVEKAYLDAIPIRRMGQPADVAGIVAYLASEEAGFLTGAVVDVTGGQFMP